MRMRKHTGMVLLGLTGLLVPVVGNRLTSDPGATLVAARPATADAAATATPTSGLDAPVLAAATTSFLDSMDGAPASPTPWRPGNWDVTVHARNPAPTLEPMQASHGPDCAGPPATHLMSTYEQAVFQCRSHMMTAIQDVNYGMIYLTPDHMVDFSAGEAVVSFDMSTLRKSPRDWVDFWITPYADNMQLPLENWLPDVSGEPRNAVHVTMGFDRIGGAPGGDTFKGEVYRNFVAEPLPDARRTFDSGGVVPDAARRDKFEFRISRDGIRFGMPQYGLWFIEASFADLGWSRGVVQLGQHAYNPNKDCFDGGSACSGTWHWDNVSISPAVPFTILQADKRSLTIADSTVSFSQPAPADSRLRFAAIGSNMQVSFNGGGWQNAVTQAHIKATAPEHFSQYWMPVPTGTQTVAFRGERWWGGEWEARDLTVWADNGQASPPGQSGPGGEPPATPLPTTSTYAPLNPARLLDTRPGSSTADGVGTGAGLRGPGAVVELQIAGRGGVPANATAVTLNVTSTASTANGFVTAWPCGERPNASNLNYTAGLDVANAVLTRLGPGGKVCLYNGAGATHLVADVNGFYPATSAYAALVPARLLDTRPGAATADGQGAGQGLVAPGQTVEVSVAGRGGVPTDAAAVVLNVTSADGGGPGFVTAWPCGQARPLASSLNFSAGRNVANAVISSVGAGGKVCLSAGAATTHLLADVNGYFPSGAAFSPLTPARLLDTRPGATTADGQGGGSGITAAGSVLQLQVGGRAGVPANANAAVLNVTSTGAGGNGFLTVWPCGQPRPLASNLNYAAGRDAANAVISSLGTGGKVCIYTGAGATHLVADVTGYFATDGTTAALNRATPGLSRSVNPSGEEFCRLD